MNSTKLFLLLSAFFMLVSCHHDEKPVPTVSSFSPSSGTEGTTVTITGTNFNATPANNVVTFNGVGATVTTATPTQLVTTVPAGATTGTISISVSGSLISSTSAFTVLPSVTSFSPAEGIAGTTVVITGTGFSPASADNIVKFNGVPATVTAATTTQLTTTVPAEATSGKISVTVAGNTATASNDFTVRSSCQLTSYTNVSSGFSDPDQNITSNINFIYDDKKNLLKYGDASGYIIYTYTNGLITKVVDEEEASEEVWSYNDKKLINHIDGKFTDFTSTYSKDFTYNDAGKLVSVVVTRSDDDDFTTTYTYTGDNVKTVVSKDNDTQEIFENTSYSVYDTKNNPFLLLAKATGNQAFFISEIISGLNISKNNALDIDEADWGPGDTSYEYNSNGYPTKITQTFDNGGKNVVTMTYSNCN